MGINSVNSTTMTTQMLQSLVAVFKYSYSFSSFCFLPPEGMNQTLTYYAVLCNQVFKCLLLFLCIYRDGTRSHSSDIPDHVNHSMTIFYILMHALLNWFISTLMNTVGQEKIQGVSPQIVKNTSNKIQISNVRAFPK